MGKDKESRHKEYSEELALAAAIVALIKELVSLIRELLSAR